MRDSAAVLRRKEAGVAVPHKVVGLGAPISVQIRLDAREVAPLRTCLRVELGRHDRGRSDSTCTGVAEAGNSIEERTTLEDMLRSLDGDDRNSVEVCWPTEFAHPVLRRALADALARVSACDVSFDALDELGAALETARACFATWLEFESVEYGGLP